MGPPKEVGPKEVGPYQPCRVFQEAEQQERFTNRTLNIVVIALTLISYPPLLLDATFYDLPVPHMLLISGSGILYSFVGIRGMVWFEQKSASRPWLIAVYFLLVGSIIAFTFWIIEGFENNAWLLILPVAAQSLALSRMGTAVVCISLLSLIYFIFLRDVPPANALQAMMQITASMIFTLIFTYIALREPPPVSVLPIWPGNCGRPICVWRNMRPRLKNWQLPGNATVWRAKSTITWGIISPSLTCSLKRRKPS
jgi:hypothetical protein